MRRAERLTRDAEIDAVFNKGKAWASGLMVIRAMPNGLTVSRFGFIVSKKVDPKAVGRNRVKRLLRETVRLMPIRPGWDIMVIARSGAAGRKYGDIKSAMVALFNRANLLDINR